MVQLELVLNTGFTLHLELKRNVRDLKHNGFTLTELLIALALLGIIAVFTIPKVLQNQQTTQWKAIGKETVQMIDGAYKNYQLNNTVTSSFTNMDLTPYMNYVAIQTTGLIDNVIFTGTISCDSTHPCLRLHNGAAMRLTDRNFFGTSDSNAVAFIVDPDGQPNGGDGLGVQLWLYYGGRITSRNYIDDPTCTQSFCPISPQVTDPAWFSWQ